MTLFKRVEAATAEMERIVGELSGPCEQVEESKRKLDKLQSMAAEVSPSIVRLRKAGEETDPAKKTYGEQMAQKVLALCDRYDALEPRINEVREKVTAGDDDDDDDDDDDGHPLALLVRLYLWTSLHVPRPP